MAQTHYDVLGVARDADVAVIRQAYVAEARRHHPDRGVDGDGQRMARINEAWAVLGDPRRRRDYDDSLDPVVRVFDDPPPWRPYDDGPSGPEMAPEDLVPATTARRTLALGPAVLFLAGMATVSVGVVTSLLALLVLGGLLLLASAASFVLAPFVTMLESYRNDPDR